MMTGPRSLALLILTATLGASCGEDFDERPEEQDAAVFLVQPPLVDGALRDHAVSLDVASLDTVPVPRPANLEDFVRNEDAAIVLGKALFWDQQVGSDGQACASCHFSAGADDRVKNQLTPGLLRVNDPDRTPDPDDTFGDEDGLTGSGAVAGPNYTLVADDYPFHRLEDPDDRNSCNDEDDSDGDGQDDEDDGDCFDMNDATSSQGTFGGGFISIDPDFSNQFGFDICNPGNDPIFNVRGIALRKVEPRNTPSMINAVFNHRNFWDGRANNIFNGLNPLGERGLLPTPTNPNPGTPVFRGGAVVKEQIRINNASLASQSVGPPLSDFEMSCAGRTFADLGAKMIPLRPLQFQVIHPNDSVLRPLRNTAQGLQIEYRDLIELAFRDEFWAAPGLFDANGDPAATGFTQMEVNFPLFFGLAIQLYEATLVSDETPFDDFMRGDDGALDEIEQFGLQTFLDQGKCINCHSGPELTGASVRLRANEPDGNEEAIERMVMGDGGVAVYDGGFYNIGVRPTFEDLGVGSELAGFPLSFARQIVTDNVIDDFEFDPDRFEVPGPIVLGERVAVDGAFKTAQLRNSELTGPYFHNGGQATLRQVVDFYDRGGDRQDQDDGCDTTRFAEECSNLDPDIQRLGLDTTVREIGGYEVTAAEALVAFLEALTDERVREQSEPFDHPQLFVPNGHRGTPFVVEDDGTGQAVTRFRQIRAVGRNGGVDVDTFLGLDPTDD